MEDAVRYIERRTGASLSGELAPVDAAIVETLMQLSDTAVRLVLTHGRWLDLEGQEWVQDGSQWRRRVAA